MLAAIDSLVTRDVRDILLVNDNNTGCICTSGDIPARCIHQRSAREQTMRIVVVVNETGGISLVHRSFQPTIYNHFSYIAR